MNRSEEKRRKELYREKLKDGRGRYGMSADAAEGTYQ